MYDICIYILLYVQMYVHPPYPTSCRESIVLTGMQLSTAINRGKPSAWPTTRLDTETDTKQSIKGHALTIQIQNLNG